MKYINEAGWDRILRTLVGIALLWLGIGGAVSGALEVVVIVLGAILLVTGVVGFCPLYALLKVRTNK